MAAERMTMTVEEAAEILGISRNLAYELVAVARTPAEVHDPQRGRPEVIAQVLVDDVRPHPCRSEP